eukprot:gene2818-3428_t
MTFDLRYAACLLRPRARLAYHVPTSTSLNMASGSAPVHMNRELREKSFGKQTVAPTEQPLSHLK